MTITSAFVSSRWKWKLYGNTVFINAFTTSTLQIRRTSSPATLGNSLFFSSYPSSTSWSCTPREKFSRIGFDGRIHNQGKHLQSTKISTTSTTSVRQQRHDTNHDGNPELESFIEEVSATNDFFASSTKFPSFESIGVKSQILLDRVQKTLNDQSPKPSAVQAASYAAILSGNDVTIGAETGSGKTLAYLLPLLDDILQAKQKDTTFDDENNCNLKYEYARAVILVPNKELANQVIRMAAPLCGGEDSIVWSTNGERRLSSMFGSSAQILSDLDKPNSHEIVRLGFLPGELKTPDDYKPFRLALNDPENNAPLDILICTPASLGPWGLNPKNINLFADIKTIIIDEADMLFDGGYLRQLENSLLGFKRADRLDASFGVTKTQHILVAATLPSMGTKSVDAYVQRKFPYATRVTMKGMHNARHYGLGSKTIWVEDDYDEMTPKKRRMEYLVKMLKSAARTDESNVALAGEKIMIFLNNVNDVDSATNALRRAGIEAVPFHAKMPLTERTENLKKFRKYVAGQIDEDSDAISVLVCTDLAARGLDIPGVTAVVQLQFAGNVVTHLHRMGRCGRAGNRNGRGVIFYGGIESELVNVIRNAEHQQEAMILKGNDIEEIKQEGESGKVEAAFSRKRGFTRKRKKFRKAAMREEEDD